jgi:succinate-semialdehyde dehydrogenase/glutarate-semialdehyde dehydrogenase
MSSTATNSAVAAVDLKDMRLFREACYVDGQWVQAADGGKVGVDNPASGEIIGTVPKLSGAEARHAIEVANEAFKSWSARTAKERANVLRKWFDLMMENQEDLARLMTLEQGKPLTESRGEVAYAAAFLEWFGEEAKRVYGDTIPGHQADKRIVVLKQPIGVVACITPWNFPLAMITRKAGPALAAGCTVVIKPAAQTPFSALALAELAERAGVPKGVLNVVTGSAKEIGARAYIEPDCAETFTVQRKRGKY